MVRASFFGFGFGFGFGLFQWPLSDGYLAKKNGSDGCSQVCESSNLERGAHQWHSPDVHKLVCKQNCQCL
jgi:hypothetical protein